ncbi:MAG: thiamine phosphate synthase [Terriglobales bacterium]
MPENCLLYYITDRRAFPGDERSRCRRLLEKISEAARAGVDYIQLREKDLTSHELESLAREAVSIIRESSHLRTENRVLRTALLINSRTDVALAVQADGVHLRSDGVRPQEVRAAWTKCGSGKCGAGALARELSPPAAVIGVSCHSPEEVAQAAANGATFAVLAPIFEKIDVPTTPPVGLSIFQQASQANIPVLALGGITLTNAHSCLAAGAAGIAAIRLFQDNDIATVVKELRS